MVTSPSIYINLNETKGISGSIEMPQTFIKLQPSVLELFKLIYNKFAY